MKPLLVIGGGPAGIMAAVAAAEAGAPVMLWERNRSLGRKLAITGKGRCNLTNAAPTVEELIRNIPGNGAFLHSAFFRFGVEDTLAFFEQCGLAVKTERGRRVFPQSDDAHEVVATLAARLRQSGATVCCERRAARLLLERGKVCGVVDTLGQSWPAGAVIIATGGVTYPATGSTGDGYRLAQQAGHSIVTPRPSLVPLETQETWPARCAGLSLRNVNVTVCDGPRVLATAFGELLFTHFGLSGPVILTLSRCVCDQPQQGAGTTAHIDLKPALTPEQLDERLQRNALKFSRKHFVNSLGELLPASLIPVVVELSGIAPDKPVHQISKAERRRLGALLKDLPLTVTGPRPIAEAIVTAGGVAVREIDPRTMASRCCPGLYFAGEVIDVDGFTGGYNLQAAWSTGHAAGTAAARGLLSAADGDESAGKSY